ncbi:MAG TPA: RteC domain-containing protein [Lutibacter sp.]
MIKIATIIENFDLAINDVKKSDLPKLVKLGKNIKISKDTLYQLRLELRKKNFISTKDEILFFKHQKPYIRGRLNFYLELNNFLINFPISGVSQQRIYINEQISKLETKKSKVLDFAKYCKLKATRFDHIYFLRANHQLDLFMNKDLDDPEFSTSHDYLASQIITFDLLMKFYVNELSLLKTKKVNVIIEEVKPAILRDLSWTASKTDLIELIFALYESKALRNGQSELKKIVAVVELIFEIELGNVHKVFDQIRAREKDPTKFLDNLKYGLVKKINSKL